MGVVHGWNECYAFSGADDNSLSILAIPSLQVQEQHTEIKTLTTTTKYLKAQLRDNEEVQNKAIRAERRKAKEELARMKGAMVAILDKERKAMREELKRQTNELRGLLKEAMTDGDYVAEQG